MSDESSREPPKPPTGMPTPPPGLSPEDLAHLLAASGVMPTPPSRRSLRSKLLVASLIGAIGLGASVMSCVGQSFSYRQAHALEGIEQQLREIHASCVAAPPDRRGQQ